jgi:hypothetical protein
MDSISLKNQFFINLYYKYMCYSEELSKKALIFGVLSGLSLIGLGDDKYKRQNISIGFFFIFVSLMQYVEYLIWTDTNCQNGNNEFAGEIGPLLNYLQPTVFLIIIIVFMRDCKIDKNDILPFVINIGYLLYITYQYKVYLKEDNTCSTIENGHLSWAWVDFNKYMLYQIIMIFNILYYITDPLLLIAFFLSYFYFFLSYFKFKQHVGELWCYLVPSIPLIILIIEKAILK